VHFANTTRVRETHVAPVRAPTRVEVGSEKLS
jgi:hypothetical protein